MHGYRRFCNKIYQATKFVLGKLDKDFVPQKSATKTGKESLSERWILHKMTIAARDINQALADREFSQATSIIYQYWYSQLCDVYIENSKSIIQDGTPEEQRSAKETLYTALEAALTMIHPFMPFLTEEMWQRLPRRPDDITPSIVKAKYPVYDPELDDVASEEAYELLLGIARGVRSLMADYSIKEEGKGRVLIPRKKVWSSNKSVVFVQTYNDTSYKTARTELQSIKSLSGKGVTSIEVYSKDQEKPTGCVVFAVSSSAAVFLHVKGRVDIDEEIRKAQAKLQKASEGAAKQRKILGDPNYQEKVSAELQEVEKKKLADHESEMRNHEEIIGHFEKLKLE